MRLPEPGERPSGILWFAAVVSLLLPVAGVAVALYGVYTVADRDSSGWYWVAAGTLLILADMAINDQAGFNHLVAQVKTVLAAK